MYRPMIERPKNATELLTLRPEFRITLQLRFKPL